MKIRVNLKMFCKDKKVLYIILSIVMVSVLTLTVVYAALSTTLQINGQAEISSASWDIYLDNIQLNSNSATTNIPTITNKTTASFTTTLSKPGDFYEFSIDVMNNGSIDAMIDSVTKTPELTDTQKKYLNYIVEYQNGESVNTKQLVSKKSFVRLRVKVEFRKDITASDLPQTSESLNLSFKVNYVQSDDNSENITIDNNGKLLNVVSGNLETVGSEVSIGNEHFYIISSDSSELTLFSKYNLYVGNECTTSSSSSCTSYEEATGIQNSTMIGYLPNGSYPKKGTADFATTNYWSSTTTTYPSYVYDSNSNIYNYIENYRTYLVSQGANIKEARLISIEELVTLGCDLDTWNCGTAPEWVYSTSYWTGTAYDELSIWTMFSDTDLGNDRVTNNAYFGVRPVIAIAKSAF